MRNFIDKWWIWEIFCSVVSITFLIATVALLVRFDKKPYDEWYMTWRINSVISLFVTIMRTTMLVTITTCIGQLKWIWFSDRNKRKPLEDIDKFDKASRGPGGSFVLLASLRFR